MKIDIKHTERQAGLFKKKTYYDVTVDVKFTEEEKHIIEKQELRRQVLLERERPADRNDGKVHDDVWWLEVFQLLKKPNVYTLATPLEAKTYENDVIASLKNLKGYLDANASVENKSTSLEL